MSGQARMLVECGPEAVLAAVTVKKSATENSQLNKQRSYRHVGRYSGSFSPPGDHIRLAKDSSISQSRRKAIFSRLKAPTSPK